AVPAADAAHEATGAAVARRPPAAAEPPAAPAADEGGQVVLDYCAAVRGILNDDQGGPVHPPGLRMAEALREVGATLQRNRGAKKGGAARGSCGNAGGVASAGCTPCLSSRSRSKRTSTR